MYFFLSVDVFKLILDYSSMFKDKKKIVIKHYRIVRKRTIKCSSRFKIVHVETLNTITMFSFFFSI